MPTTHDHWSREPGRWEATLAPEAWATIPMIATPRPSPDGRRIAYLRGYDGRLDVWVVDSDGGFPMQLTDAARPQGPDLSQRQATSIAWTPDSRDVVFASNREGKLWRVSASGGPSRPIDEAAGNHHSPAVSPDGTRVAYVAERGEQVDIFVAALNGSWVRQMTSTADDEYVAEPKWSPDGRRLLWVQWPHFAMPWDETAIVVADVESGERSERWVVAGGERTVNNWPQWHPDGATIVYISDRGGEHPTPWQVRADGSSPEPLIPPTSNDYLWPCVSPDGRAVAFTRNADNETNICIWRDGELRQVTHEPGVHSELAWIDERRLVCVYQSPLQPPDLWSVTLDGERRQLTCSATGGVAGSNLTLPQVISWTSRDGTPVHGMLFTPSQTRPGEHPLVVHIHGGPVGQANKTWIPWIQYLVQRGYLVLVPNYRGSKGYGRTFMEQLYGDWGGGDLDDNITGAEAVIAGGLIDRSKVVATGGSAGGYGTLICMTRAPEFFKAGICRYGIADLTTFTDRTWVFEKHYIAQLMRGPGGRLAELYRERSPLTHVDKVRGPLLILQGEDDIVCHRSEMDKMAEALRRAGKYVEYQVYPDEGHGWKHVSTIVDDAQRSDDFLVRMVLNR
jgi:dipeptidyl aminopeptidase/acylaminoacyl peptidase